MKNGSTPFHRVAYQRRGIHLGISAQQQLHTLSATFPSGPHQRRASILSFGIVVHESTATPPPDAPPQIVIEDTRKDTMIVRRRRINLKNV